MVASPMALGHLVAEPCGREHRVEESAHVMVATKPRETIALGPSTLFQDTTPSPNFPQQSPAPEVPPPPDSVTGQDQAVNTQALGTSQIHPLAMTVKIIRSIR